MMTWERRLTGTGQLGHWTKIQRLRSIVWKNLKSDTWRIADLFYANIHDIFRIPRVQILRSRIIATSSNRSPPNCTPQQKYEFHNNDRLCSCGRPSRFICCYCCNPNYWQLTDSSSEEDRLIQYANCATADKNHICIRLWTAAIYAKLKDYGGRWRNGVANKWW